MPAQQHNFVPGHEYDLGDGTTAVWGGKRGWMKAEDYVAMKGTGQTDFDDKRALMERLDKANSQTGAWDATGAMARFESGADAPSWSPLHGVGGTAGYNLDKTLVPVRANSFIQNLSKMRQQSPTGGAVGNVTEKEGEKIQSTDGILDVGQSRDQLRDEIRLTKEAMARHVPGLHPSNPIELTEDNRGEVPQGAFFRAADGAVYQNRKGAGFGGGGQKPAQPAQPAAAGTATSPHVVTSEEDYNRLPSKSYFKAPDGSLRRKP